MSLYSALQGNQSLAKKPEDFHNAISRVEPNIGEETPDIPSVSPGVIGSNQCCGESCIDQASLDPLLGQPFGGILQVPITPLRKHTPQGEVGLRTSIFRQQISPLGKLTATYG